MFSAISCDSDVDLKATFVCFLNPLNDDDCAAMNSPVTIEEIEQAIGQLPLSKTPGPVGISAVFYKTFKITLSPILLVIFKTSYDM